MDDSRFHCVTDYTYVLVVAFEGDFSYFSTWETIVAIKVCLYVKELKRFNYELQFG